MGQNATFADDPWYNSQPNYEPKQPHITGVAVTSSGICGNYNFVSRGDCMICGKSFATIKEEITFDYLERTHQVGESHAERLRRRNAFEAGMNAGSFILVPGGVSQTAACDGTRYEVASDDCGSLPLPLQEFCRFRTNWPSMLPYFIQEFYYLILHNSTWFMIQITYEPILLKCRFR